MKLALDLRHLLHGTGEFGPRAAGLPWRRLVALLLLFAALHGACVGAFGLRGLQILYSALKLPLLLGLSTAICLPNFYAVNAVLGLRDDFGAALRGVLATQATVAVVLASLSPLVALIYVSSDSYPLAIVGNGVLFAVAALGGQVTLARHYEVLIARNARHLWARRTWLVLYVFVAIQLAWMLRPFVGAPEMATSFFRSGPWSNAYVVVLRALSALFA